MLRLLPLLLLLLSLYSSRCLARQAYPGQDVASSATSLSGHFVITVTRLLVWPQLLP